MTKLLDEISRLSEAEHIELIEEVWRTMLPNGSFPPFSDEEKSPLDARVRDAAQHPTPGRSWDEVEKATEVAVRGASARCRPAPTPKSRQACHSNAA